MKTFNEAMAELRAIVAENERPKTLAAATAEKLSAVETELEFMKRDQLSLWQALLALTPVPTPH